MRLLWIVVVGGCLLAIAISVLTTNIARSVLPGIGSASTSTTPTSITFLFSPSTEQVTGQTALGSTYQWSLTLPRAYISSEIGTDKDVGGTNLHAVSLFASANGNVFKPAVLADTKQGENDISFIDIKNGPNRRYQCDRSDDMPEFIKTCDDKALRCLVRMSHKGWSINVMMAKRQYLGDYKRHCASISAFLDSLTTKIEPL